MTQFLIYQDYTFNNGGLYKALAARFGHDTIAFADADDILNGKLTRDVKAFFMPGGATRYVAAKLNGAGNAKIREYVSMGGIYVGICAGAYYACRRTEWRKDQTDAICVNNELAFFPGTAIGPVTHFDAATITPVGGHAVFYWGGPTFHSDETGKFEIIATYDDLPEKPAAIVTGRIGKGRYLLVSPHPEIDAKQLEMMRFDVTDNRHAELQNLVVPAGVTTNYFNNLLDRFIA